MGKTLRVRTRDGWTTKPPEDVEENRLTAEEVDDNFLALEDDFRTSLSIVSFGASTASSDNTIAIQDAVDTATADGLAVYVPFGTFLIDPESVIELPTGAFLWGGLLSALRHNDGATLPVLTNKDRVGGNAKIRVVGLSVDGNNENAPANQRYSTAYFVGLTNSSFVDINVRGGCRKSAGSQGYPGSGEGLELVGCERIRVLGGHYAENHYDGIKFRNTHHSLVSGANGLNNGRGLCQVTGESGNVSPTGSTYITVTGCSAKHDTGVVDAASEAPYTSGLALHSGRSCTLSNNVLYGMVSPIDGLEGADDNVITGNLIAPRSSVEDRAAILFREWSSEKCNRNTIRGNRIKPIDGSSRTYISVDGDENTIDGNRLLVGGSSGTWGNVNAGNGNVWSFNRRPTGTSFADNGSNTEVHDYSDIASGGGFSPALQTLTDGSTIDWTLNPGNIAEVTLGGNRTLANPSVLTVGTYPLIVRQDETGGRTLAFGDAFTWPGGTAPSLTQTGGHADLLVFECDGVNMIGRSHLNYAVDASMGDLDSDVQAIIDEIESTDAGALTSTQQTAINDLVTSGKSDGWWPKITGLYGFVGGTADSHGINWKNLAGGRVFWDAGATHSPNGVAGDGSSEGDTGVNANAAISRDDNCLGFYCNGNGTESSFEGIVGVGASADSSAWHIQQGSDNTVVTRNCTSDGASNGGAFADILGLMTSVRPDSTTVRLYKNGTDTTSISDKPSEAAPKSETIRILSRGAAGPYFSGRLALVFWGASLTPTDVSNLSTAVGNFQGALGRAA